jgi:hypothetical protein
MPTRQPENDDRNAYRYFSSLLAHAGQAQARWAAYASEARRSAAVMRTPDAKLMMLEIAEKYERLLARLDA